MPTLPRTHSYSQPNSPIDHPRVRTTSSGAESHSDKLTALPDLLLKLSPSLNSSPRMRNQPLHPHSQSSSHSHSQSHSHSHGGYGHGLFGTSNSEPELHTNTHTPNHSPRQNLARLSLDSGNSLPSIQRVFNSNNTRKTMQGSGVDISGGGGGGGDVSPGRSRSQSFSRTASPLRIIQQWAAHRHTRGGTEDEEDPFVPINPFKWRNRFLGLSHAPNDVEAQQPNTSSDEQEQQEKEAAEVTCKDAFSSFLSIAHIGTSKQPISPHTHSSFSSSSTKSRIFGPETRLFLTDILPRQIYLHLHLRLPALYFSRVARIFEDAEVSKPDVQRIINACRQPSLNGSGGNQAPDGMVKGEGGVAAAIGSATRTGVAGLSGGLTDDEQFALPNPEFWTPPHVSPALARFKQSWEAFIDTLVREWKTFNVVSALLLSAITTMFQVPQAVEDTVTRTAALLSLTCALMSLSYGCVYIVRFGGMRSMVRASRWAEEARKSHTAIFWNVWILLATPAVWLAWSMVGFIVCILSFVWRSNWHPQPEQETSGHTGSVTSDTLLPQILITVVFVLGLVYFGLIVHTLAGYSYGSGSGKGKKQWQRIVHSMSNDGVHEHAQHLDEDRGRRRRNSEKGGRGSHRYKEKEGRKKVTSENGRVVGLGVDTSAKH